jgi:hypothetical protein
MFIQLSPTAAAPAPAVTAPADPHRLQRERVIASLLLGTQRDKPTQGRWA